MRKNKDREKFKFHTVALHRSIGDGTKPLYRAVINHFRIAGIRETSEELHALGCSASPATIEYILQSFADELPYLMATDGGRPRRLGNLCVFTPVITGAFDAADADFDPNVNDIQVRARVTRSLRDSLRDGLAINATPGISHSHVQRVTGKRLTIYWSLFVDEDFSVYGRNLSVNPACPDEGVWLMDGKRVRTSMPVVNNGEAILNAHVPAGFAVGTYTLIFRTRGGLGPSADIYEFRHQVRVRPTGTGTQEESDNPTKPRRYTHRLTRT